MKYRRMGKWGVELSVVGLGSFFTMGVKLDQKQSRDTVVAAYENGINFFDTADAYALGEGEKHLGKCLAEFPRKGLFVISKVHTPMSDIPNDKGLCYKHIKESIESSLSRLGMDYLDLYMCHRPDLDTPLEETVRAMEDLIREGKILYWGVSEWPAHLMVKANAVAKEIGARGIGVNEPRYSMLWRYPENTVFPISEQEGIGNVVFSPLAHGMLTGKYKPGEEAPEGTRAADPDINLVIKGMYWSEENKENSQELVKMAEELGTTAATLSLAWCLRLPAVTSTIIGASKASQVVENANAADLEIPEEMVKQIDELFPAPKWPEGS